MRALLVRLTALTAVLAALLSGLVSAATHASWIVTILRSAIAFVLVAAVGIGFGLILMRTAFRRHYEEAHPASRRARGNR